MRVCVCAYVRVCIECGCVSIGQQAIKFAELLCTFWNLLVYVYIHTHYIHRYILDRTASDFLHITYIDTY